MKSPLKKLVIRTFLSSVCLPLLHPVSTFAMDPKTETEAAKEILGGIKRFLETDQKAIIGEDAEHTAVVTGITIQEASSSSSSIKKSRVSSSAILENTQIASVELEKEQAQEKYKAALEQGNQPLAALWRDIISQREKVAEYSQKSLEAVPGENGDKNWLSQMIAGMVVLKTNLSISCLQSAVEAIEKATVAITQNDQELAVLWQKAKIRYQKAAEYYQENAHAIIENNGVDWQLDYATQKMKLSAFALEQAAQAVEKVTITGTQGNLELVALWQKIAIQHQEAAEYYQKCSEVTMEKGIPQALRWQDIALKVDASIVCLKSIMEAFEKAAVAAANGNHAVAILWRKVVIERQKIDQLYQKSMEGFSTEEDNDTDWQRNFEEELNDAENSEKIAVERAVQLEEETNAAVVKANALVQETK